MNCSVSACVDGFVLEDACSNSQVYHHYLNASVFNRSAIGFSKELNCSDSLLSPCAIASPVVNLTVALRST